MKLFKLFIKNNTTNKKLLIIFKLCIIISILNYDFNFYYYVYKNNNI